MGLEPGDEGGGPIACGMRRSGKPAYGNCDAESYSYAGPDED
jgi:hypothetical protein